MGTTGRKHCGGWIWNRKAPSKRLTVSPRPERVAGMEVHVPHHQTTAQANGCGYYKSISEIETKTTTTYQVDFKFENSHMASGWGGGVGKTIRINQHGSTYIHPYIPVHTYIHPTCLLQSGKSGHAVLPGFMLCCCAVHCLYPGSTSSSTVACNIEIGVAILAMRFDEGRGAKFDQFCLEQKCSK